MKQQELEIKKSKTELFLITIAYVAIISYLVFFLFNYRTLPDNIPANVGEDQDALVLMSKEYLLLFPFTLASIFIGLSIFSRFPKLFTYPVTVTERNVVIQRRLVRNLLSGLKIVVAVSMLLVEWQVFQQNINHSIGLKVMFIPFLVMGTLVVVIIYFSYAIRYK